MKTVNQKDMAILCSLHYEWLDSNGKSGERLDLRNRKLENITLINKNLEEASFRGCIFKHCRIEDNNFEYTDLSSTLFLEDCEISGNAFIESNITNLEGIELYSVDNIGTYWGKATYNVTEDTVFAGCWKGSLEDFLKIGLDRNKGNMVECNKIQKTYEFFNSIEEE